MALTPVGTRPEKPPTLTPDPLGFPLLTVPAIGLACHLFPATKVQFEYYLGGTPRVDASCYFEMLEVCPRVSWRLVPSGWAGGLFASAARPDEATLLAKWLGDGFRLPTATEWQRLDVALNLPVEQSTLHSLASNRAVHPCARTLFRQAADSERTRTWRTVGFFEDGLLEWVQCLDGSFGLHGRPRSGTIALIHNPQRYPPIRPATNNRHPAFGFRLVRSLGRESRP
jgi:hypothetical protein